MDEYKVVYRGLVAVTLPYEEVLTNLVSRLSISENKAERLIRGPALTLKIVPEEEEALKFQAMFEKLGLDTEVVRPLALTPVSENTDRNDNAEPPIEECDTASVVTEAPSTEKKFLAVFKKLFLDNAVLKLSNIILIIGVVLTITYFPFIDGVVRYGFALGVFLLASSLSLKSVDR